MWTRIYVQPGVGGGRIRQYTAAGGAPVVESPEGIELRRDWRVSCAGGQRAASRGRWPLEGRIRLEYEAAGEGGRPHEVLEGMTVPQTSIGALEGPAVGHSCFLLAVY